MTSASVDQKTEEQVIQPVVPDSTGRAFPWSFRSSYAPTEGRKSYARFQYFLSMGVDRTLSKVAFKYDIAISTVSKAAKDYQWKVRAAGYDENKAIMDAENDRRERHESHLAKLEAYRSKNEQLGGALGMAAVRLLQHADKTLTEMKDNGETFDRRLVSSALLTAAKLADMSKSLVATSLGVDALVAGLEGAEGDDDAYT